MYTLLYYAENMYNTKCIDFSKINNGFEGLLFKEEVWYPNQRKITMYVSTNGMYSPRPIGRY
jgi:hypothetical protein